MSADRSQNKTQITPVDPMAFLDALEHPTRRADALVLDRMFRRVTGWEPKMWGPTMVGYGSYHYKYATGREGDMLATGFSPRKANLSLYIMPGYADFHGMLDRLGKHKHGKACLYVNKLADIDIDVLAELVKAGLDDLAAKYPVTPT
ncbi:MAG: DUF1801 domain-containing protein [Pseudomonadota bacterium]